MKEMKNPEPIRVAVADDHPLYREGVVSTIDANPDMVVVAQGASAAEAVKIAESELPDIILLDITMPGKGLKAAAEISEKCPVTKVVMLTVSEDEEDVLEAFRVGASAYILKGVSAGELTNILRSVQMGEVYVTPALASQVLIEMSDGGTVKSANILDILTDRERQILERVACGDLNKEIAYDLKISEKTVKHYMTNIMQKLHARNRVEAALLAHDAGLGDFQGGDPSGKI
jgi:two-component system, NarL family, nitrate/nitrite response regulator NarL